MKEYQIIKFKNDNLGEIQGFMKDGEPWFLASHVCKILGIKNHRDALSAIRKKRSDYGIPGVVSTDTSINTGNGIRKTLIIPEKVLYELIFQSRKKVAYLFQIWVYDDVLPSLRKYGEYRMAGKLIRRSLTDTIQDSGEQKRMHGHGMSSYTLLIYEFLNMKDDYKSWKKLKNDVTYRDTLSIDDQEKVMKAEDLVKSLMNMGKQYNEIKSSLYYMFNK